MKCRLKNIIFALLFFQILLSVFSYAEVVDKKGRVVYEVTKPTAKVYVETDDISDTVRRKVDVFSEHDATKNIFSNGIINESENIEVASSSVVTVIRHTSSIANVEDNRYELIEDRTYDRLRLKIKETGVGEWDAKNGFYRVNGKVYYFDERGLMVLGNAIDNTGRKYYFSEETGELLYEE